MTDEPKQPDADFDAASDDDIIDTDETEQEINTDADITDADERSLSDEDVAVQTMNAADVDSGDHDSDDDDELGVESALAALASLNDLAADAQADDTADTVADDESDVIDSDDEYVIEDATYSERDPVEASPSTLDQPPPSKLYRGQAASIVPAVLLMGAGALLTFLLTTGSLSLDGSTMAALLGVGSGGMLLAYWLTSRRWSQGSFFIGTLLLLGSAMLLYLVQPNTLSLAQGYPLLGVTLGVTFILTSFFTRGTIQHAAMMGVLCITAGSAGLLFTSDILTEGIVATLRDLWIVGLVIVVLLVVAPFFRRREDENAPYDMPEQQDV